MTKALQGALFKRFRDQIMGAIAAQYRMVPQKEPMTPQECVGKRLRLQRVDHIKIKQMQVIMKGFSKKASKDKKTKRQVSLIAP